MVMGIGLFGGQYHRINSAPAGRWNFCVGVIVRFMIAVIACAVCCCLLAGSGPHVTVGSGPRPDRVMMNSV